MFTEEAQTGQGLDQPSAKVIFGQTAGMRRIQEKIEVAFHDDLPVLIEGESGTGKEVIARFLHRYSLRREGPFLKFNCAASPANLLAGEIYGSETSAMGEIPGSHGGRAGLVSGGTLFFDEVGELDLALQQRLGNTVASGRFWSGTGSEDTSIDARVVSSSSTDMGAVPRSFLTEVLRQVRHHSLRLLPLRERKEDIPELCEYLVGKFAREFGRPVPRLSSSVLEVLMRWRWPGNIRELENWIARIVIFGAEEAIGLQFNRQLVTGRDSSEARAGHRSRPVSWRPVRRLN